MTMNGVMADIWRYFTEFDSFAGYYVTVVAIRSRFSAAKMLPIVFGSRPIYGDILVDHSERVR